MSNGGSSDKAGPDDAGFLGTLGRLSAMSLTVLGALYVMGFVVVNGYQTKYLHYSATALQLKHLTAGMLYAFLTFFQIAVTAFFLLSSVTELPTPKSGSVKNEASKKWLRRLWTRAVPFLGFVQASLRGLLVAAFVVSFVFGLIGYNSPSGSIMIGALAPWTGINLVMSIVLAFGMYVAGIRSFQRAIGKKEETSKPAKEESETVTPYEIAKLRLSFIESYGSRVGGPIFLLILLILSLVSFQRIYGRLRPDYGGGALYRVRLNLQTPSGPSEDLRSAVLSTDSWLFLVDKDGSFAYALRVDKDGNQRLIAIAQSEIKAMEIVAYPPIAPIDAPFFINRGD